jgi:hypothetical protein
MAAPEGEPAERSSRLADPAMSFAAPSKEGAIPEDAFYLTLRDARPSAPLPSGVAWSADAGTQPPPAWLPAVHEASVVSLGAQVHFTAFARGRFAFRMVSGAKEIVSKNGADLPNKLDPTQVPRALAAIALGTGRRKGPRGLAIDGAVGLAMRGEGGALVIDREHGTMSIERASDAASVAPSVDKTELPLTADAGKLLPEARDLGSMRARAAACMLEDGTFVLATTTFDSDEATTTPLLELGCTRVVALDRGSHMAASIQRASAETAQEERYESTVLYAIAEEMAVGAAAEARAPAKKDPAR